MRIDKFLSENGIASRKEAGRAARAGQIIVNGKVEKDTAKHISPETDEIYYMGQLITHTPFLYIMLNKPEGYVSATEDGHFPVVVELLDTALQSRHLFPCGRLDKDTTGLMLLTNDGQLSHLLLSPRRHVEKRYRFTCAEPLRADAEQIFSEGLTLKDGDVLLPSTLYPTPDRMGGEICLKEGKYHQIKRMLGAIGNRIVTLERISFGPLSADPALGRGQWRYLTDEEVSALRQAVDA
ncbi:MAG: rRNA pseudouridine synthase [Clostridia bacterium]|nr:rRNA pseudouridine synthase [Clostridia bacterium]